VQDDPRLGRRARQKIEAAVSAGGLHVSAITPWEIALLAHKSRISLSREVGGWIDEALSLPGVRLAPLLPSIAVDSVRLPSDMHGDPADRIIIATARHAGLPRLTADKAILRYAEAGHVAVIDATN
jgi:PIN domain nuclease of toxin-antitoxin system